MKKSDPKAYTYVHNALKTIAKRQEGKTELMAMHKICKAYQAHINKYEIPEREQKARIVLLSLYNEVSEIADLIHWKDWKPSVIFTPLDKEKLTFEITDVLFFIFELCDLYDISMEDLVEHFYTKVEVNLKRHVE